MKTTKNNNMGTRAIICSMLAMGLVGMTGCSHKTTEPLTVQPSVTVLTPNLDGEVMLNTVINVPANYVTKRGMVEIEPKLILGDEVAETLRPFTLTGAIYEKKAERLRVLHHMPSTGTNNTIKVNPNTPLSLELNESLNLSDDWNTGKIVAYVSKDGCDCQGSDTLTLAYLSNLSSLIDADNLLVQWIDTMPPLDEKYFSGEGQARLQFIVDKWDIVPDLADNAAQLDTMIARLTPVLTDSLSELQSMSIFGSASVEGGYDHNVKLARDRANSALEWVNDQLHLTPKQRNIIKIGSEPEGWGPVIASMHAAGNPDSAKVKAIVAKYPDLKSFEAERRIRKLDCWPDIVENHLAKDRRVTYKYGYKIRQFTTDKEKLEMIEKRPDAFSEAEFLRVAKIRENNPDSLMYIYETMLRYKPGNKIALNNLAVLYYNNGLYDKAIELIEAQGRPTGEMLTTLALSYTKKGDDEKAMQLLKGVNNDKAIYNLGVIQANNHQMAEAYYNLMGARDLNSAIAALGVGENTEAWDILYNLNDTSAKANYVRAIAQVRLGNYADSIKYLKKAIKDPEYKERALNEADFMPLHDEWNFQKLFQ